MDLVNIKKELITKLKIQFNTGKNVKFNVFIVNKVLSRTYYVIYPYTNNS